MSILVRLADDVGRSLAAPSAARQAGGRMHGGQADARRIGGGEDAYARTSRSNEDEVEVLGVGGRGRPVVSMPSSAFFAQHIGQHPESRNDDLEQAAADGAYKDALDMGVAMDRPMPLSLAI